jgi:hypothetical protein
MASLDRERVWRVLPSRLPGMVPPVVAVRFPGVPLAEVVGVLEAMVADGHAVRTTRRGHDVYYRGALPRPAAPAQPDLFTTCGE